MLAALPLKRWAPVEATQTAPASAIEAVWVGAGAPLSMSRMLAATALPIAAEGMPVRGAVGLIGVPLGLFIGLLMACGGAKAMPTAKRLR